MNPIPPLFVVFFFFGALVLSGCEGERRVTSQAAGEVEIGAVPEVLISTQSGVVGEIDDLLVGEDGSVFLSDPQSSSVYRLPPGGGPVRSLGRPGGGPGEFRLPGALAFLGDTLAVADLQNARVQLLTPQGDALGVRPFPPDMSPVVGPTLGPLGRLILPTLGRDSALALVYSGTGGMRMRLGETLGGTWERVDERALRQEVARGGVPGILLNLVLPAPAADGTIWLVLQARGAVERYGPRGNRIGSFVLSEPEFPAIREAFVARNRDADPAFPGLYALRFFADASAEGPELWLLLAGVAEAPTAVLVLSGQGRVVRRYRFPAVTGATRFAVDRERNWIYFALRETAELVRVPLSVED